MAARIPPPDRRQALIEGAATALRAQDGAAAARAVEELASLAPRHPRLPLLRGDLAALAGDDEGALRHFRAFVAARPDDPAGHLRLCRTLEAMDLPDEACTAALAAAARCPPHAGILDMAVRLALATGRPLAAEAAVAAAVVAGADPAILWPASRRLAGIAPDTPPDTSPPDTAPPDTAPPDTATTPPGPNAHLARLAENPADRQARNRAAAALRQTGRIAEARSLLAEVAPVTPADHAERIADALARGDLAAADALLDRMPQRRPEDTILRHRQALRIAALRGDLDTVQTASAAVLAARPGDAGTLRERVQMHIMRLDHDAAWQTLADYITAARLDADGRRIGRLQQLFGTILNEMALERPAVAEAATLLAAGNLAALSRLVDRRPHGIGPALGLMLAMARAGRIAADLPAGPAGPSAIPPVLHQYWETPAPPPAVLALTAASRAANPGLTHRMWHDRSAVSLLARQDDPAPLAAFRRAGSAAARADLLRLALLWAEGGHVLGVADVATGPLAALVPPGATLALYQDRIGTIGGAWMAATPGHPLIGQMLQEAVAALNEGAAEASWLVTGPGLLTRIIARAAARADGALPPGVSVLALPAFLRIVQPNRRIDPAE